MLEFKFFKLSILVTFSFNLTKFILNFFFFELSINLFHLLFMLSFYLIEFLDSCFNLRYIITCNSGKSHIKVTVLSSTKSPLTKLLKFILFFSIVFNSYSICRIYKTINIKTNIMTITICIKICCIKSIYICKFTEVNISLIITTTHLIKYLNYDNTTHR